MPATVAIPLRRMGDHLVPKIATAGSGERVETVRGG
jgi:hypothetical protein